MTAVLKLQKEKIYNPTALQIAEQTEAVIIRDAEDIEEEDFRRLLRRLNIQTIRKMCLSSLLRYRKRQKESREQNRIYRHEITVLLQSSFPILFQENTAL